MAPYKYSFFWYFHRNAMTSHVACIPTIIIFHGTPCASDSVILVRLGGVGSSFTTTLSIFSAHLLPPIKTLVWDRLFRLMQQRCHCSWLMFSHRAWTSEWWCLQLKEQEGVCTLWVYRQGEKILYTVYLLVH